MNTEQNPEQQALAILVGKWTTEAKLVQGEDEPIKVTGTDEFRWFPGGMFLQHRVDLYVGSDKVDILDMIGTYEKESGTYPLHSFDNTGGYTKLTVSIDEDGIITMTDDDTMRTTLTPAYEGGTIAMRAEKRENGDWKLFMEGSLTKSEDKL